MCGSLVKTVPSKIRGGRPGVSGEKWMLIRFVLYNIRKGCNGGLESYICRMTQDNIYLGFSQETNLIGGIYVQGSDGDNVLASDAPIIYDNYRVITLFSPWKW